VVDYGAYMGRINVLPKKVGNEFQGRRVACPHQLLAKGRRHNTYCPHSIYNKYKFNGYIIAGE